MKTKEFKDLKGKNRGFGKLIEPKSEHAKAAKMAQGNRKILNWPRI